jgi:hypothetical protein
MRSCSVPRADAPERRPAFGRQLEADASPVVARADPAEQAERLEPVDMGGERGRRDALGVRELTERKSWARPHEPKECCLMRRDAELFGLTPELSADPEDHGPELLGDLVRRKRSLTNHS